MYAQLEPLHNQYQLNGLAINPAFTGADEALSITLLHRNQWVGFEGAPTTSTFAIHSPMKRENLALGFLVMHDQIGISRNTSFAGSYAYRIISPRGTFSFGLGAALRIQNEALEKLRQLDTDDQYLPTYSRTYLLPDFNIGFYYKTQKYYAGISMLSLLGSKINTSNGRYGITLDLRNTNYMLNGGYFATLSKGIKINPGTLIKYNLVNAFQVDLNLNMIIRDKFWFGTSYRSSNGMIWLIQFQANNQARIAYSYGMDFSTLGNYHKGSHEIMLKYVFNYLVESVSPKQY
jgi:type IX secretion system PorP/SprF family membrane protein